MPNCILFDDFRREQLLPLTFTRPVSSLFIGMDTILDKWTSGLGQKPSQLTAEYLHVKYSPVYSDDNLYINGGIIPDADLINAVKSLKMGDSLEAEKELIAFRSGEQIKSIIDYKGEFNNITYSRNFDSITRPWHLFQLNDKVLRDDFARKTNGRKNHTLSQTNTVIGSELFAEEGVSAEACIINTTTGPVFIEHGVELMEGCMLRGPIFIGKESTVKMGAKIYGATTVGPSCKVGGEISNSIFTGYSNKSHDGFLGNSVIGEWCNFGADSNNSNLKNNYAEVKLWDYVTQRFIPTGTQFCGLMMGDHSKCGINTMFNTGTVAGVFVNIFGAGFPRNYIPSFSWGGASGLSTYKLEDAFKVAEEVMKRRHIPFTLADQSILRSIFEMSVHAA